MNAPQRFSLTHRQQDTMHFIMAYRNESGGISPSYAEIMDAIGVRSKSTVNRLLNGLEERGRIIRMPNRARTIQVIE
ncbi:LexA family transcriptional regulator [Shinella sp. JR1-6]|uniref:LexA family protein n=1 Tax=Shinella sp. JR1-6 TaxID=2527671 RepID=UPI001404BC12|nr:helix-turn-helix domain-containing protein [Shinella sp. JR1-6]